MNRTLLSIAFFNTDKGSFTPSASASLRAERIFSRSSDRARILRSGIFVGLSSLTVGYGVSLIAVSICCYNTEVDEMSRISRCQHYKVLAYLGGFNCPDLYLVIQNRKVGQYIPCKFNFRSMISQQIEPLSRLQIHSRNQKFSSGCDTVLCYHRKIKHLILGRYCRYHRFELMMLYRNRKHLRIG